MIRFRCRECNKKLKAEPTIVGRKVKCTRCPNVERVPPEDRLEKFQIKVPDDDEIRDDDSDDFAFLMEPDSNIRDSFRSSKKRDSDNGDENKSDLRLESAKPKFGISTGKSNSAMFGSAKNESKSSSNDDRDGIGDYNFDGITESDSNSQSIPQRSFAGARSNSSKELKEKLVGIAIALLALATVGTGAYFAFGYFMGSAKFDTEFEELGEVFHYRAAKLKLEKSGRQMGVVGRAFVAMKNASPDVLAEMKKMEAAIKELTAESTLLVDAHELCQKGEGGVAKELLVGATVKIDALRVEVDLKMNEFMGKKEGAAVER